MNRRTGGSGRTLALGMLLALVTIPLVSAAETASGEVALDGYCPVAYAAMGKAVEGDAKFASDYKGKTYYLANADAKKMFEGSPERYLVAYDGWCATAMAKGMKVESDPTIFVVRDGRTYLFSTDEAKDMFTADASDIVAMANKSWAAKAHQGH
jgi:YHS domain-containing protein